jgi:cytochrome c oxidase subunit 2
MDLHVLIGWLSLVVFVLVIGLLVYFIARYRRRGPASMPDQVHGNTRLEILWTLAPVLIVAILAVPTVQLIVSRADPPRDRGEVLEVTVIGHQWWWEFVYPSLNITTANDFHIPTERPINMNLTARDVIHSFWVPALGGKQDAIPNRFNSMWFRATEPGVYHGQCMEFCGLSHALMRHRAVVHSPADFEAWVRSAQSPAAAPSGPEATRGSELFVSKGCAGCHTIQGLPRAVGQVGPNLTHFGSRTTIAAGVLEHTPENLRRWLSNPQAVKPGALMPNLGLTEDELNALVPYLEGLK